MLGDWLEGTLHDKRKTVHQIVSEVQAYFSSLGMPWMELDRGMMGYTHSAKVGSCIRVLWHSERSEMGVHVIIPSSGLAEIGCSFESVCADFFHKGMIPSRIDIAADDFEGVLDLVEMGRKVKDAEFVCRGRLVDETKRLSGGQGHTIYFGRRGSNSFARAYDKSAEQADKCKGVFTSWVRVEMEYRGDRAQAVFLHIVTHSESWREDAKGWLLSFLDFKSPSEDQNKSRWLTVDWWAVFLDNAAKLRLVIPKAQRTIEDVRRWVQHQVAPSLLALGKIIGWDNLFAIIVASECRLSESLQGMIAAFEFKGEVSNVEAQGC